MLLTIDIGNSKIKAAIFDQGKITSSDSFYEENIFESYLKNHNFSKCAICSVVPEKSKTIVQQITKLKDISPFIISSNIKTNLSISYKTPATLGTDRLCSAEGAYFLFKNFEKYKNYSGRTYILSIDFGTATTINVIEYPEKFIGGLIAPGIDLMFNLLNKNTAQLPNVDINDYDDIIGNSTDSSIASGVVSSVSGMVEKVINSIKDKFSAKEIFVYLTGGNAKKIIPFLEIEFTFEENLVHLGINELYKLNN
jgi:type III pantothenate kinase